MTPKYVNNKSLNSAKYKSDILKQCIYYLVSHFQAYRKYLMNVGIAQSLHDLSLSHNVQTGSGAHPAPYPSGTGVISSG
jgi:hypothetical protein